MIRLKINRFEELEGYTFSVTAEDDGSIAKLSQNLEAVAESSKKVEETQPFKHFEMSDENIINIEKLQSHITTLYKPTVLLKDAVAQLKASLGDLSSNSFEFMRRFPLIGSTRPMENTFNGNLLLDQIKQLDTTELAYKNKGAVSNMLYGNEDPDTITNTLDTLESKIKNISNITSKGILGTSSDNMGILKGEPYGPEKEKPKTRTEKYAQKHVSIYPPALSDGSQFISQFNEMETAGNRTWDNISKGANLGSLAYKAFLERQMEVTQKAWEYNTALETVSNANSDATNKTAALKTSQDLEIASLSALANMSAETRNNFEGFVKKLIDVDNISDVGTQTLIRLYSVFQQMNSQVPQTATIFDKLKMAVKGVSNEFSDFRKQVNNVNFSGISGKISNGIKTISQSVFGLTLSLAGIINYMKTATTASSDYIEALNLFKTSMDESATEAEHWIATISDALLLDPKDVMQYAGQFKNLAQGLGVASDAAYIMANGLTQLTYDMGSYLNISSEMAFNKIQSAMSGQTKAVTNVGIAMQTASLQELAYSLGIQKTVRDMTQAEKTYLRYIQIMKSTSNMQGDLGRTIITPANALKVLKTQFVQLARAIGNVFIPIIMKLIPWVMAITEVLRDLANTLSGWLGFEIADINYDNLEGLYDWMDDIGDKAEGTKGKINNMLAPFDELNVVENKSSGSGADSGDDITGILKGMISSYDMLEDYTDELKKKAEDLKGIVVGVGIALITAFAGKKLLEGIWNLSKFFHDTTNTSTLASMNSWLTKNNTSWGKLAKTIAGAAIAVGGYFAAYKGAESGNLDVAGGGILAAGGGLLLMGHPILAMIAAVGAGITGTVGLLKSASDEQKKKVEKDLADLEKRFSDTFGDTVTVYKKSITKLKLSPNQILDSSTKDAILNSAKDMLDKMTEKFKTNAEEQKDILKRAHTSGIMSDAEFNEAMSKVDEQQKTQISKYNDLYEKQKAILAKYGGDTSKMTKEDYDELMRLSEEYNKGSIEAVAQTGREKALLGYTNAEYMKELSKEEASEMIKNALKTKNETIQAAIEKCNSEIAEAERLRDAGLISEETYNKMVSDSKTTRDNTIKNAKEQYDGIYSEFENMNGDIARYIDKDTGEVKSKWDLFWEGMANVATTFANGFITNWEIGAKEISKAITKWTNNWKVGFNEIKKKLGFDVSVKEETHTSGAGYTHSGSGRMFASGGMPESGSMFIANEQGPEFITSFGHKSAVINQQQMVNSLASSLAQVATSMAKQSGGSQPQTIIFNVADETIYKGQINHQNREIDRYGSTRIINI